jgi:peptide chain release factor 2
VELGGQHVNKTESAIRIVHIPTNIIVTCQAERSQIQNRERAMKILKSKLYLIQKEKEEEELRNKKGEEKDIAWGSQIRSYVFQPYQLVKDHRTNYEIGNVQSVMDGNITGFLHEYLILKKNNKI